jgi:hypothetical protein
MADRDRGLDHGGGRARAADARAYWRHEGAQPREAEWGTTGTAPETCQGLQDCAMKVWIYVDTNYQVGHRDHLKVFANDEAAEIWFEEHDPEGVAFEYEVIPRNRILKF